MSTVGSKNYNGQDWFWPHDYRHYLRDANPRQRKLVHNGWLKIGVPVKKSGLKISDRYLEPKKSQEKKAWTIVKKVIAPKELESVNEELNSSAYSQLSRSIKAIAINIKDLAKAHKKQDDGVVRNEIDNLLYDVKRMVNIIGNKKYNESVNEGMTKYNIRLTKTPGWYGIWDKNGKQKAEGEKKYIIKFLKSLKTRMGNFQIKSLVDLAADRKGTNIAFDVAESINEGFADKLTKKMKKHKGTSVKSKKKVKLKGRGVYQQYESDLPITTKKGKTVRAVHKKSGKEIVSVDNPSTRKILKKMGFVVKEFKYNLYQKLSDKQKVLVHLISKGNKASDAKKMVNKWYDKVSKMYKNANISKKAEIISTLSAKNEGSCGYGIDGKVGKEPAGPHLIKKKKKKGR